ncbi:hypothetical protein N7457_004947 [Penicillium paradoxum]|uniref:uncharacterized protein n=1 Tax=Penicillium paradoxum TaxID=176176 RepID=UPI0025497004|nr:uncharacterized protein N7457_004947 [Penicillium paradoxum]KAJ5783173.1 hypothetical protein N7457_004947 [Penicillium paradoxum]
MDSFTEEAIREKRERTVSKISRTKPKITEIFASKVLSNDCDKLRTEVVNVCGHIERKANTWGLSGCDQGANADEGHMYV